jgi:hypothetical protein
MSFRPFDNEKQKVYNRHGMAEGKRKSKNKTPKAKAAIAALAFLSAASVAAGTGYALWHFGESINKSAYGDAEVEAYVDIQGAVLSPSSFKVVLEGNDDVHWENESGGPISQLSLSITGAGFQTSGVAAFSYAWASDNQISDYVKLSSTHGKAALTVGSDSSATATFALPTLSYTAKKPTTIASYNAMVSAIAGKRIAFSFNGGINPAYVYPSGSTSIPDNAFANDASVESVVIPNGVTSIGASAFKGCSSLRSVSISNTVNSVGANAFTGCSSLSSISFPDSVASIGNYSLSGCSALTSVSIGSGLSAAPSGLTTGCLNLESISVSSSNAALSSDGRALFNKNKTILYAYANQSGTSYTVPSSVSEIGTNAFSGCDNLSAITLQNGLTAIDANAFQSSGLTSVSFPSSLVSIGNNAFNKCDSLNSVSFGNVQTIGNSAFAESAIQSLSFPSTLASIGAGAFSKCGDLSGTVAIPASVATLDGTAFQKSIGISGFSVASANARFSSDGRSIMNKAGTTLLCYAGSSGASYSVPSTVTTISKNAFDGVTQLTSVSVPASVTSIGKQAFLNCSSLTAFSYVGTTAQWTAVTKTSGWAYGAGFSTIACSDGQGAI